VQLLLGARLSLVAVCLDTFAILVDDSSVNHASCAASFAVVIACGLMAAVVVKLAVLSSAACVTMSCYTFCTCGLFVYQCDPALHAAVVVYGFMIALVVMHALMTPGAVVSWCQTLCGCSASGNICYNTWRLSGKPWLACSCSIILIDDICGSFDCSDGIHMHLIELHVLTDLSFIVLYITHCVKKYLHEPS
jgi:hypothetical protein